jgi:competence protein ComEA
MLGQARDMPEFLLQRRRLLLAVAGSLVLLLLLGRFALGAGTTTPAAPLPPPPAAEAGVSGLPSSRVVVDVVGAVRRPGLYRLAQGSRIADAVTRAGGTTRKADLAQVNLAAPVADGEQIVVPQHGQGGGQATASGSSSPSATSAPVQLSTATLEQLDSLPGVGPVTAQKILDYRQKHGAFRSVDELDAVPGIGTKRLDQLRDLVVP